MGGGKLKWRQLAQSLKEGRFTLVHTEKLIKPMIKGTISRRMLSSGISNVAFASVYSEKTRMKKCWIMIIIIMMNKSQELTVFPGRQKLTSAKN